MNMNANKCVKLPSYSENLVKDLESLREEFIAILEKSAIGPTNANFSRRGVISVGNPNNKWIDSPNCDTERRHVLGKTEDFFTRFRLLFPHQLDATATQIDKIQNTITSWVNRKQGHGVPSSIKTATNTAMSMFGKLSSHLSSLPTDEFDVRVVVDTNVLLNNPDLDIYTNSLGAKYIVHVVPEVMREIDNIKMKGRSPDVRGMADRANKRLKKYRDNGDVTVKAKVSGSVYVKFEHREPQANGLPTWLDLSVPDDRIVASSLRLQSQHPGSCVVVATGDTNLQTKLTVVRIPFIEE
jgi:rRNA-processing protein FCF1